MPPDSGISLRWPGHTPRPAPNAVRLIPHTAPNPRLRLFQGNNLDVLHALAPELGESVTLIYLDPPFLTMRQHERVARQLCASGPPIRVMTPAFDDRWEDLPAYLASLRARLEVLRTLLAPDGSLVVHVDPRTSHYIKVMGDEVFGCEAFASELVWRYRRWPAKTPNFQRVHDVLLRWVKDPSVRPRFFQQYEELAPSTLRTWGRSKQQAVFDETGRRRRSSTVEQASPGAPLGDVWEVPIVAPVARERTGYPTQKPEALLERLVRSCSGADDLVLDPYMGSGTTVAVAARLGRRAIGIDESTSALEVALQRLSGVGLTCELWSAESQSAAPASTASARAS